MNARDLVKEFPWANKPSIVAFADSFTRAEWKDMETAGVPVFINSGQLDPQMLGAFFASLKVVQNHPTIAPSLKDGSRTFADIISTQLKAVPLYRQMAEVVQPDAVMNWLGKELCDRIEEEIDSYNSMDNLVQCLSSENTRKILSGDAAAIALATFLPDSFAAIKGRDIRQLYRQRQISYKQFEKYITDFAIKAQQLFPRWIEEKNNIELNQVASGFSVDQHIQLEKLVDKRIQQDKELSISFLRALLMGANHQLVNMKKCPANIFAEFVKVQQQLFFDLLYSSVKNFKPVIAPHAGDLESFNIAPLQEQLIRKHLDEYKIALMPIPTDKVLRQKLLEATLRNAANRGDFWDVFTLTSILPNVNAASQKSTSTTMHFARIPNTQLSLVTISPNLNAVGNKTGRTALHFAVDHAMRTGNRLCFDFLRKQSGIDMEIRDGNKQTALDLWDFAKYPDAELQALHQHQLVTQQQLGPQ